MGFLLPVIFEDFYEATTHIVEDFFILQGRYTSPDLEVLIINIENEVKLYLDEVTYLADRSSQAKVFTQLALELKNDKELKHALVNEGANKDNDKAKLIIANAQQVVLGALIHRLIRINNENSAANLLPSTKTLFSIFVSTTEKKSPKKCRLMEAIERILNISNNNQLDSLTVKTTCEALLAYMTTKDKYKQFEHYQADVNFIYHLTGIIKSHTNNCKPIVAQVNKLLFLQSIAVHIKNLDENINSLITGIETSIVNKDTLVNMQQVFNVLSTLKPSDELNSRFHSMLDKLHINPELEWQGLFSDLRELLNINSIYSLLGAFMIVFFGQNEDKLSLVIRKTLHWTKDNDLNADPELKKHAYSFLKSWVLDYDSSKIQWRLFDGKDIGKTLFMKEHSRLEQILIHETQQKYVNKYLSDSNKQSHFNNDKFGSMPF